MRTARGSLQRVPDGAVGSAFAKGLGGEKHRHPQQPLCPPGSRPAVPSRGSGGFLLLPPRSGRLRAAATARRLPLSPGARARGCLQASARRWPRGDVTRAQPLPLPRPRGPAPGRVWSEAAAAGRAPGDSRCPGPPRPGLRRGRCSRRTRLFGTPGAARARSLRGAGTGHAQDRTAGPRQLGPLPGLSPGVLRAAPTGGRSAEPGDGPEASPTVSPPCPRAPPGLSRRDPPPPPGPGAGLGRPRASPPARGTCRRPVPVPVPVPAGSRPQRFRPCRRF